MYRIIYLILITAIISCTSSDKEAFYLNDDFDIIYVNDTSVTFYSKSCINPYEIFQSNGKFYINSKAFYCSDEMKVLDYNIDLKIYENDDDITIESNDSCFINFFGKPKSKFVKMHNLNFDFELNSVEIIIYNDLHGIVRTDFFNKNEIDKILLSKLWIISNPNLKVELNEFTNPYIEFKFYKNDSVIFKRDYPVIPCWYNNLE